ncbi:DnaB-like helicase N-terminal domain-containing protein [Nitrosophilus kaiyonis]|uniref:DnaB-like helicase N-terminal domain-containing protein n=1 Tax=Nitrosophilus kaiyonis TaxID=2930200 RepID=UPI002490C2E8|nr:DnaB-like helicase N-terminal domain-containing protein [Nitrosophilus kaiyonis]
MNTQISIERAILSTILNLDFTLYDDQKKIIDFKIEEKYFSHPNHRKIAIMINKCKEFNLPPSSTILEDKFNIENMDNYFKNDYLEVLAANNLTFESFKKYYEHLKSKFSKNILKAIV